MPQNVGSTAAGPPSKPAAREANLLRGRPGCVAGGKCNPMQSSPIEPLPRCQTRAVCENLSIDRREATLLAKRARDARTPAQAILAWLGLAMLVCPSPPYQRRSPSTVPCTRVMPAAYRGCQTRTKPTPSSQRSRGRDGTVQMILPSGNKTLRLVGQRGASAANRPRPR